MATRIPVKGAAIQTGDRPVARRENEFAGVAQGVSDLAAGISSYQDKSATIKIADKLATLNDTVRSRQENIATTRQGSSVLGDSTQGTNPLIVDETEFVTTARSEFLDGFDGRHLEQAKVAFDRVGGGHKNWSSRFQAKQTQVAVGAAKQSNLTQARSDAAWAVQNGAGTDDIQDIVDSYDNLVDATSQGATEVDALEKQKAKVDIYKSAVVSMADEDAQAAGAIFEDERTQDAIQDPFERKKIEEYIRSKEINQESDKVVSAISEMPYKLQLEEIKKIDDTEIRDTAQKKANVLNNRKEAIKKEQRSETYQTVWDELTPIFEGGQTEVTVGDIMDLGEQNGGSLTEGDQEHLIGMLTKYENSLTGSSETTKVEQDLEIRRKILRHDISHPDGLIDLMNKGQLHPTSFSKHLSFLDSERTGKLRNYSAVNTVMRNKYSHFFKNDQKEAQYLQALDAFVLEKQQLLGDIPSYEMIEQEAERIIKPLVKTSIWGTSDEDKEVARKFPGVTSAEFDKEAIDRTSVADADIVRFQQTGWPESYYDAKRNRIMLGLRGDKFWSFNYNTGQKEWRLITDKQNNRVLEEEDE